MRSLCKAVLVALLILPLGLFLPGVSDTGPSYTKAHAALWDAAEFLVPCGNTNWVATDSGANEVCYIRGGAAGECTVCDLVQLAQNIVRILIFLATCIAVLLFVYAGWLYIQASASPGNVSKAHGIFISTLIGLVVTLAAWLIIDTIMKTFYGDGGRWGPWNDILCDVETAQERYCVPIRTGMGAIGGGIGGGGAPGGGGGGGGPVGAGRVDDAGARTQLANAGICVWDSATKQCRTGPVDDPGATSLHNMRQQTLDVALDMKEQCPTCEIVITGGTESGPHVEGAQSHGSGYKIDIDDTPSVNQYIESNWQKVGARGSDPIYMPPRGMFTTSNTQCVKEGDHWDCLAY